MVQKGDYSFKNEKTEGREKRIKKLPLLASHVSLLMKALS